MSSESCKPVCSKSSGSRGIIPDGIDGAEIWPPGYAAETGAWMYRESPPTVVCGIEVAYIWLWEEGAWDTHGFVNCGPGGYLMAS